jgi:hypothetical protein
VLCRCYVRVAFRVVEKATSRVGTYSATLIRICASALCLTQTIVSHSASMSAAADDHRADAGTRRRGVAHLVFLHYTSFGELSRASAERAADPPFTRSVLQAAFRSVINATSRKRSTHETEYLRLRGAALRRQQKRACASIEAGEAGS